MPKEKGVAKHLPPLNLRRLSRSAPLLLRMLQPAVGDCLCFRGATGSVRWIGVLPSDASQNDVWMGVEWHAPFAEARGRHRGFFNGVAYFEVRGGGDCASFLRGRSIGSFVTLHDVLAAKYAAVNGANFRRYISVDCAALNVFKAEAPDAAASKLDAVRTVELHHVPSPSLALLALILRTFPAADTLVLHQSAFIAFADAEDVQSAPRFGGIHTVKLHSVSFGDRCAALSAFLAMFPALKHFSVCADVCDSAAENGVHFLRAIASAPVCRLETLRLRGLGLRHFAADFSANSPAFGELRTLSIVECAVQSVHLFGGGCGDASTTKLHTLIVDCNAIDAFSNLKFDEHIGRSLQHLSVLHNPFYVPVCRSALVAALPQLKLLNGCIVDGCERASVAEKASPIGEEAAAAAMRLCIGSQAVYVSPLCTVNRLFQSVAKLCRVSIANMRALTLADRQNAAACVLLDAEACYGRETLADCGVARDSILLVAMK